MYLIVGISIWGSGYHGEVAVETTDIILCITSFI